jgi:ribosomal protein L34E
MPNGYTHITEKRKRGKASHCQMVTPTKLRNKKEVKEHISKWLHPYNGDAKKRENITLPNGYTHITEKRKRGNTSHCQMVTPTKLRNEKEGKHHFAKWLHAHISLLSYVDVTI